MHATTKKTKLPGIPDDVHRSIKCCLSNKGKEHYVVDAILLKCGGNACRTCIDRIMRDEYFMADCHYCDDYHDYNNIKLISSNNKRVKATVEEFMNDLKSQLVKEINQVVDNLNGYDDHIKELIEIKFENFEYEVDARVESIINGLHQYREELMSEIRISKEKYLKNLKFDDFNKIKKKLDDKRDASNYEEFIKAQKALNESKIVLQKYLDDIHETRIDVKPKIVFKELLGEFKMPFWKKRQFIDNIPLKDVSGITSFAYSHKRNFIYFNDAVDSVLKYDLKNNEIVKLNSKADGLVLPRNFFVNDEEQLILIHSPEFFEVRNSDKEVIVIYDKNFKLKKTFKTTSDIGHGIFVDKFEEKDILYLTYENENKVSLWDIEKGKLNKSFDISAPSEIKIVKDLIYIISKTSFDKEKEVDELKKITFGSNCIFILSKITHKVIDIIKFDNWLAPTGIDFDQNGNLLTLAYEIDKNMVISNYKYLYVIDCKKKELIQKIKIEIDKSDCKNFFFADNKIFILNDASISVVHLESF